MDYITLDDEIIDESVSLTQEHVDGANRYVARVVKKCGRDPEDVELPLADLADLAIAHAYYLAFGLGIVGQDSESEAKCKFYRTVYKDREQAIIDTLPMADGAPVAVGGSIEIGRS